MSLLRLFGRAEKRLNTAQYAAIEALRNCDDDVIRMRDEYNHRRRVIVDGFRNMGLSCFEPYGAFYVFPCIKKTGMTSEEFCNRLLEEEQKIGPNSPPGKLSRTAASFGLTKRETEIVYLVCAGKSSEDICSQLFITPATLSKHLSNIYSKTKVRNRTQLFGLFHEV